MRRRLLILLLVAFGFYIYSHPADAGHTVNGVAAQMGAAANHLATFVASLDLFPAGESK